MVVFPQMCQHDNTIALLLPDHLPEGLYGGVQRALCGNEGLLALIRIDEAGIDEVRAFLAWNAI